MWTKHKQLGFTIVELLIIIVVIGVLAAISVVAYSGVQNRARDSRRVSDAESIIKALELYKINTGSYPMTNSTMNAAGWEVSTTGTAATNFLSVLVSSGVVSKIPLDPANTGDASALDSLGPDRNGTNFEYFYYRYPAGYQGCDPLRGNYYVFGIARMDSVTKGQNAATNPGFVCPTANWSDRGAWVTGDYER